MKRIWIAAGLPLAIVGTQALAQNGPTPRDNDFSYDYIQLGYERYDWDDEFEDGNMFRGDVQYAWDEHILLRAGADYIDGDEGVNGLEWSVGAGYTVPIQDRLDAVVTADIVQLNVDEIDDETGFRAVGKVRFGMTETLELAGGAFMEDLFDTELGVLGQAIVEMNDQIDVGAEVKFGGSLKTMGVFARYNY